MLVSKSNGTPSKPTIICKYGPTSAGITLIKFVAIALSIPVSFSTPKNIPAAIITAAIINAFGACALNRSICSSTDLKLIISANETPIMNANSGGAIFINIARITAKVKAVFTHFIHGCVRARPFTGNLTS